MFDVKAFRALTCHQRGGVAADVLKRDARLFEAVVAALAGAGKLGCVLFQWSESAGGGGEPGDRLG
ncbi:MAG: hypothetical protein IRZ33_08155 [Alicyclobacillaceae bacterium]|nr:hypothetical protein [Alicyclobacillaceae bacterium]